MIGQVLADEGGDEVVAVILAFLHAQGEGAALLGIGRLQVLGIAPFGKKFVGGALVDQRRYGAVSGYFTQWNELVMKPHDPT